MRNKRLITQWIPALAILMAIVGCKKSELTAWEQPDMVYIYKDAFSTTNDSVSYSFAIKPGTVTTDTVKIPLRIMGPASTKDRVVNVKAVTDSSTALPGQHYDFLPSTILANQYTGFVNVLVKRTSDLKLQEKRLMLEVIESSDFKPGLSNTAPVSPRAGGGLKYLVKINDYLTMPSNWPTVLVIYFGAYSQVKYALVIKTTGRAEFPTSGPDAVSSSQFLYYKLICKDALAKYEAANGPLYDENGIRVTFPN
jgi:hypothetical protein